MSSSCVRNYFASEKIRRSRGVMIKTSQQLQGSKAMAFQAGFPAVVLSGFPAGFPDGFELLTCFDHNSSRSTNFLASEVVPNAARRDLSIGAESKTFPADFDYDLSREDVTIVRTAVMRAGRASAGPRECQPLSCVGPRNYGSSLNHSTAC